MKKNENVVFITQARTGSTRLPGKVMKEVLGKTVLYWFLRRALRCTAVSAICVATTVNPSDDALAEHVRTEFPQIHVTRGSEEDVLSRYLLAAQETSADIVVRVTSDCPFFDWELVDRCVNLLKEKNADAVRTLRSDFPIGLDVEVFSRRTLEIAYEKAGDLFEREHVGPYVFQTHSSEFHIEWVKNEGKEWPECRLTLDFPEDLALLEKLYDDVGTDIFSGDYRVYLARHPEVTAINLNLPH